MKLYNRSSALPVGVSTFLGMLEAGRQIILKAKRGASKKINKVYIIICMNKNRQRSVH